MPFRAVDPFQGWDSLVEGRRGWVVNIQKFDEPATSLHPVGKEGRKHLPIWMRLLRMFGVLAGLASVLALFAEYHWLADAVAHGRVQYLALLFLCLIWSLLARKHVMTTVIVLLMASNAYWILPYWMPPLIAPDDRPNGDSRTYRLLVFNVLRTNEQHSKTFDEILRQDADFVFLSEVHEEWIEHFGRAKEMYPHQKVLAVPDYTGVAFLSKQPWSQLEVITLGAVRNPSLDITIEDSENTEGAIRLIGTHPLPPFGGRLTTSRDNQLLQLAERMKHQPRSLLFGDFNLSPWSPRFRKLLRQNNLTDASLGFGLAPTLTPLPTFLGGVKVDHVLKGEGIDVIDYRCIPAVGSDHQMIVFDFRCMSGEG